jgi:hypothetical protein
VFDKEFREEWEMNGLPDKHDRFDEKKHKPIAILSKDGSITIRSEKGINIESSKDINIQSNKNINMYAKKNIKMEADKKIKSKSEKESIVESPKIYLEGTEGSGKVDVDAKKINVGSKDNTQQVKMAANSVKKKDNMNYTLGGGIKVEYKHYVAALQDIFNATSTMRNIQAGFASKFISGVESATVGIHNKNSVFEFPFTLAKVGAQVLHRDYRGVFDANGGFKLEKYGMEKH